MLNIVYLIPLMTAVTVVIEMCLEKNFKNAIWFAQFNDVDENDIHLAGLQ